MNLVKREAVIEIVCVCRTGFEAIEGATRHRPDVVLMDTDLSKRQDLEAVRVIRKKLPETSIIMLAQSDWQGDLFSAIRAGATGYVSKDVTFAKLIKIITLAVEDDVALFRPIAVKLLNTLESSGKVQGAMDTVESTLLSKRESQVLVLVARGASNANVASALSISENTAKVHMRNIMDKLHVTNRQQAAAWAIAHGLLSGIS